VVTKYNETLWTTRHFKRLNGEQTSVLKTITILANSEVVTRMMTVLEKLPRLLLNHLTGLVARDNCTENQ